MQTPFFISLVFSLELLMLRSMASGTYSHNIITRIATVVVVLLSLIATICAWQGGGVRKLTGFYSVSNALMGAMSYLFCVGLPLLVIVVPLGLTEPLGGTVAHQAILALVAVGVFSLVPMGCVGVVKRVGAFFAPVRQSIALAAILVKKIDRFRAFAPGAILFLHKKASYQSWSVRLLRAYNHRQEAGKTIAALRLTVKNVCPEWS